MKREKVIIEDRRNQILSELKEYGQVKVDELAAKLGVSQLTIRRDLLFLEEQKKIDRFYGGASVIKHAEYGLDLYRSLIAEYAASLVNNGDSIFINSSMTALNIIKYLKDKRVTVITNNGRVINFEVPLSVSVVLIGGELRHPKYAMVGDIAVKQLENITAKKSFLGCSGFNIERGFTTENMNEVNVNKMMFSNVSEGAYVLADHTKLGKNSSFVSQDIDAITHLITDEKASDETVGQLKERNIDVYRVRM